MDTGLFDRLTLNYSDIVPTVPTCIHVGNNFFMFPKIKSKMCGQRFLSTQETVKGYETHTSIIPTSEWDKCFSNWFLRMEKCIELKGDYFEKQ